MPNKAQIEQQYDAGWSKLASKIDKLCEARVRELVPLVTCCTIEHITMGMGTWSLSGPDFKATWDDDSDGDMELQEIVYWYEGMEATAGRGGKIWRPTHIDDNQYAALKELNELLDWWCDRTGGNDIQF